jgi:hypothetical protein
VGGWRPAMAGLRKVEICSRRLVHCSRDVAWNVRFSDDRTSRAPGALPLIFTGRSAYVARFLILVLGAGFGFGVFKRTHRMVWNNSNDDIPMSSGFKHLPPHFAPSFQWSISLAVSENSSSYRSPSAGVRNSMFLSYCVPVAAPRIQCCGFVDH